MAHMYQHARNALTPDDIKVSYRLGRPGQPPFHTLDLGAGLAYLSFENSLADAAVLRAIATRATELAEHIEAEVTR